jgi:hypothetical protein
MDDELGVVDGLIRTIANLQDGEVVEVFQRVATMPPVSSALLSKMSPVLTDMYEASRDISEDEECPPKRQS